MTRAYLTELNDEQLKAVTAGDGPILVLAGAGSGKTRALTYRAAYLIKDKNVGPSRILLVTFTNKAAGEMKERLKKLLGVKGADLPWAGTFHSFCAQMLRRDGKAIGIEPGFTIFDEDDSLDALKQVVKRLKLEIKPYKITGIKAGISAAKNELVNEFEYSRLAQNRFQELVAKIYRHYQKLLKDYRALDFDDLLVMAVRLLQTVPKIRQKWAYRFIHVLVDEYQDTNKAQYELTKLLTSKWGNVFAVGDFSQSIYSFRGADFRNLNNLQKNFKDLTVFNLEQNYRSTQNILTAANQVIAKNTLHPILNLWTKAGKGAKIKIYAAGNERKEAEFIVHTIKTGLIEASETAVLYRTNAQSRVIEETLIKAGVPYVLVGGVRFYGRKEIKDCLAYLRLLVNPKDGVSRQRLERLGKRQLTKFLDWKRSFDLAQDKQNLSTRQILKKALKLTNYWQRFDPKDEQDFYRLENIKELMSVAEEHPELIKFLEHVALVEQTDLVKTDAKAAVTLMTLHASKGLEFEGVIMIGMEEGLFPHSRSLLNQEELEEERRLCYVGMTRAKTNLYFSFTQKRLYFGFYSQNQVSRFLADIDPTLMDAAGLDEDVILDINDY